jgi:hypothetical protein
MPLFRAKGVKKKANCFAFFSRRKQKANGKEESAKWTCLNFTLD